MYNGPYGNDLSVKYVSKYSKSSFCDRRAHARHMLMRYSFASLLRRFDLLRMRGRDERSAIEACFVNALYDGLLRHFFLRLSLDLRTRTCW